MKQPNVSYLKLPYAKNFAGCLSNQKVTLQVILLDTKSGTKSQIVTDGTLQRSNVEIY